MSTVVPFTPRGHRDERELALDRVVRASLELRIEKSRMRMGGSLILASILGWLMFEWGPSIELSGIIVGMLALNIVPGARLHAKGIPVTHLLFGGFPRAWTRRRDPDAASPAARSDARYERAMHIAATDHVDIRRLLDSLLEPQAALVRTVGPTADSLHQYVEALVAESRQFDVRGEGRADVLEPLQLRVDSAVDAMRAMRHDLMSLRDEGFERALDALSQSTGRARAISQRAGGVANRDPEA